MIRRARVDDAPVLADLNARGWVFAYGDFVDVDRMLAQAGDLAGRFAAGLSDPGDPRHVWVTEDEDGRVVGFVTVGASRDADARAGEGELISIHVDPAIAGRGVGHALIQHGEAHLRELGHRAATLWVFEDNARARRFYERHGWQLEPDAGPGPWTTWARSVRYRKALAA